MNTQKLSIYTIRTDGGTQSRAMLDDAFIIALVEDIEAGADLPPVVVFYDGADRWLADGFHRVRAYSDAGRFEVPADVRQGTVRDAVLFSVGANAKHGLRRSNADKRRAVEVLLRDDEWRGWTNPQVARACGVSDEFVRKIRAEQSPTVGDSPTRTGSDGKQYPATRPRPAPAEPLYDPEPDFTDDPTDDDFEEDEDQDQEDDAQESVPIPPTAAAPPPPRSPLAMTDLEVAKRCLMGLPTVDRSALLREIGVVEIAMLGRLRSERCGVLEYKQFQAVDARLRGGRPATGARKLELFALSGGEEALALLGLNYSVTPEQLAGVYRSAARDAHPDRGGDANLMSALNQAHAIVRSFLETP